jgi:predicted helicase
MNLVNFSHFSENNQRFAYRPFDIRNINYDLKKVARHRSKVMLHFTDKSNIGLIIGPQGQAVGSMPWNLVFVSKFVTDTNIYYRGGGMVFPLYLYIKNGIADNDKRPYHKHPNLNDAILKEFIARTGLQFIDDPFPFSPASPVSPVSPTSFAPINILDYIYAVLHSPAYRERYKEFLKIDFPRVPYPENAGRFWALVKLGAKLRRLHLLENIEPQGGFPIVGSNEVENLKYVNDKVFINDTQYFDQVLPEAWNFYIGGYQPAQKWLKDRKGRKLKFDDIRHYQRIGRALKETGEVMNEIEL